MEKKVLSCLQYVPASQIWPTATDYVDKGKREGLCRGYNIEVLMSDGTTGWDSCIYTELTIEDYLKQEFTQWWFKDRGVTPTGRISFRGYGYKTYDYASDDLCIIPCDDNGNDIPDRKPCVSA